MPKKIAPDVAPPDPRDDGPVVRHDHDHTHHHHVHHHYDEPESPENVPSTHDHRPHGTLHVPAGGNPFHQTYGREDTTPVRKRKIR
jgi:hypothetical protein